MTLARRSEISPPHMKCTGNAEASVSVSIEDVAPDEWTDQVYKPDILEKPDTLYKKPGYNPL